MCVDGAWWGKISGLRDWVRRSRIGVFPHLLVVLRPWPLKGDGVVLKVVRGMENEFTAVKALGFEDKADESTGGRGFPLDAEKGGDAVFADRESDPEFGGELVRAVGGDVLNLAVDGSERQRGGRGGELNAEDGGERILT